VADPTVGTEAERLPLNSITYEDGDDQIAIGVGGRSTSTGPVECSSARMTTTS